MDNNALTELWKELTATKRRLNDLVERVSKYFDAAHDKSQADISDLNDKNTTLEEQNQMLTDCILEMSETVYGGEE